LANTNVIAWETIVKKKVLQALAELGGLEDPSEILQAGEAQGRIAHRHVGEAESDRQSEWDPNKQHDIGYRRKEKDRPQHLFVVGQVTKPGHRPSLHRPRRLPYRGRALIGRGSIRLPLCLSKNLS
jgi:hypothetical protein